MINISEITPLKSNNFLKYEDLEQALLDIMPCSKCKRLPKVIIMDFSYLIKDSLNINGLEIQVNKPPKKIDGFPTKLILQCNCSKYEFDRVMYEEEMKLRALKKEVGLPKEFINSKLSDVNSRNGYEEVLMAATYYVKNFKENREMGAGLLIHSSTCGNGKSLIASCIANEVIEQGFSAKFVVVPELFTRIRQTYDDKNSKETEDMILKELFSCDLLILDDAGAENWSSWVEEKLFLIIDRRYRDCKPFIITTNCTLEELKSQLKGDFDNNYNRQSKKDRILDRIIDRCLIIENKATSFRLERAASKVIPFNKRSVSE